VKRRWPPTLGGLLREWLWSDDALAKRFSPLWRKYGSDLLIGDEGFVWCSHLEVCGVHGDLDFVVPLAHSRRTAELIPGAFRVLPGHGHFTILAELPAIAAELLRSLR